MSEAKRLTQLPANAPSARLQPSGQQRVDEFVQGAAPAGDQVSSTEGGAFPVVGIGASAGGLGALECFFQALPPQPAAAFVVIQHLSPDFDSHMKEILARHSQLPIAVAEHGMLLKINHIYLIPPKMEMEIQNGSLSLSPRASEGLVRPIDRFFNSLARDLGRRAIAVVLSGTGSDGTQGVKAVHASGGLVMIQDQASAQFGGMPQNAEATGAVSLCLPPAEISQALVRYLKNDLQLDSAEQGTAQGTAQGAEQTHKMSASQRAFRLLKAAFGVDFSCYKTGTIQRRISRRQALLGIDTKEAYVDKVEQDSNELNNLYQDLLISVTRFFRDHEAFEQLAKEVIPRIVRNHRNGIIRVWVVGCATGEEAYSLAMLFDEEIRRQQVPAELKLFATDAHRESLRIASRGIYAEEHIAGLTAERKGRYFQPKGDKFQVSTALRQMIVFAPHNLIRDAPFTQLELISCRNLLIYLRPAAQHKSLRMFNFALAPRGFLFLGPSETPGEVTEFEPVDRRWRIYRKIREIRHRLETSAVFSANSTGNPSHAPAIPDHAKPELALLSTYDQLLSRYMPPGVLLNQEFEILHIFGNAAKYLRFPQGRMTSKLIDVVVPSLRPTLHAALLHAQRESSPVKYRRVHYRNSGGDELLTLVVEPFVDTNTKQGQLLVLLQPEQEISFPRADGDEITVPSASELPQMTSGDQITALDSSSAVNVLEGELQSMRENLQATVEEMETSNEELQAANEELVASNEELQSTNEELHSVNEELYTVNGEHQRRVEELTQANDDMDNLLAATKVGVIFLDNDLTIRRFTPEAARVFHLLERDIGRPIASFSQQVNHPDLINELREVLASRAPKEIEAYDQSGEVLLLRLSVYESSIGIEGVVITLINISSLREAQRRLQRAQFMAESATDGFALIDRSFNLSYANSALAEMLRYQLSELDELSLERLIEPSAVELFRRLVDSNSEANEKYPFQVDLVCQDGNLLPVEISPSMLKFEGEHYLFLCIRDISEREEHRSQLEQMGRIVDAAYDAIIVWRPLDGIRSWNTGAEDLYGYQAAEVEGRDVHALLQTQHSLSWDEVQNELATAGQWTGTLRQKTKSGQSIIVSSRHQLLRGPGGTARILEINRDITRERHAQEKLEAAKQEAQQANHAKSEFLASMSHELRTPLTAVLGFADMLDAELESENQREKLRTIKKNGEYLLSLLNDILDLSKIEVGKLEIGHDPIELLSLVRDVESLMRIRAVEEGIPLTFSFDTRVPKVIYSDAIRIRQILVNLISNALKFTSEGSVTVLIRLRHDDVRGAELEFEVRDTGIGMTEKELQRLFRPFERGYRARRQQMGGTGLGLNISKRLADRLGGDIRVASKLNHGSQFTLALGLDDSEIADLVDASQHLQAHARPTDHQPPAQPPINARILLADDRRDIWRVARYFLEKNGARVTIAEDGRQAVDLAVEAAEQQDQFAIVLMDMQMPVMNGQEAIAELRRLKFTMPIIALTADAMEGEREACIKIGCDDYLPKPIDGPKLVATVIKHLAAR